MTAQRRDGDGKFARTRPTTADVVREAGEKVKTAARTNAARLLEALPERRQRFVEEYLRDGNATQAAIRAGYSEETATAQASRLLTSVGVVAALSSARSARVKRAELTADWVLEQQAALHAITAESDPDVARKVLRDIGDGLGMFVERQEHSFPQLSSDERTSRVAALLGVAKQRALVAAVTVDAPPATNSASNGHHENSHHENSHHENGHHER